MAEPAAHRAVYAIVRALFGEPVSARPAAGLAAFQQEGVTRLRDIIARYHGAVLADSVGLGKTFTARALIREEIHAGGRVLVTGPAQLERHWRRHLRGLRNWQWLSHTALSRRGSAQHPAWSFVVADEAHAFRNPRTRRHAALRHLCTRARILLVTATPVNNSIYDFYHLVRLFAADGAFADVGVPDLTAAARAAVHGAGTELRRVAEAVMVRRTRAVLVQLGNDPALPLRFPRSGPVEMLRYDLESAYPGLLDALTRTLAALTFPAHHAAAAGGAGIHEMLRLNLLKRLESGSSALLASLTRHAAALQLFLDAADSRRVFCATRDRDLLTAFTAHGQTALRGVTLPPWPRSRDRGADMQTARHELERIEILRAVLSGLSTDPKVETLRHMLLHDLAEHVLLFTEYRDTAVALWRQFVGLGGVALIHGGEARLGAARTSRSAVVERFAPIANGARPPPPHQRVRLLIATDVLAEGMNLQDARVVISYDLPWNPVRLAQRIGRIDRFGSPHRVIRALAFQPDRGVDDLLMLMTRLREKLRAGSLVGSDMPRLRRATAPARDPGLQRPGAGARPDSLTDLDEVELLRARLRRASGAGSPGRSDGIVATAHWTEPRAGAIWCLGSGAVPWLVLVRDGERPRIGGRAAYRMLLQVLDGTPDYGAAAAASGGQTLGAEAADADDTLPYGAWQRQSLQQARRALRRYLLRRPRNGARRRGPMAAARGAAGAEGDLPASVAAVRAAAASVAADSGGAPAAAAERSPPSSVARSPDDPAELASAVALRRWLSTRPGGPSPAELALADQRLAEFREAAPVTLPESLKTFSNSDFRLIAGLVLLPRSSTGAAGPSAG